VKRLIVGILSKDGSVVSRLLAPEFAFYAEDSSECGRLAGRLDRDSQLAALFDTVDASDAPAWRPRLCRALYWCADFYVGYDVRITQEDSRRLVRFRSVTFDQFPSEPSGPQSPSTAWAFEVERAEGHGGSAAPGFWRVVRWYESASFNDTSFTVNQFKRRLGISEAEGSQQAASTIASMAAESGVRFAIRRVTPLEAWPVGFALSLPSEADVELKLFDVAGRVAWNRTLVSPIGTTHTVVLDQPRLNAGVYWIVAKQGTESVRQRVVLLR